MNEVLFELSERTTESNNWSYFFVAVSFMLVSLARMNQPTLVVSIVGMLIRSSSIRNYAKETNSLNPLSGVVLTINYLLTGCYFSYLITSKELGQLEWKNWDQLIWIIGPVIYPVLSIFILFFFSWLIGAVDKIKEAITINYTSLHFIGFILAFVLLAYIADTSLIEQIKVVALGIYAAVFAWRLIRSITAVWSRGATWYYIILYLCTLEIMPLIVVYYTFK